MYFIFFSKAKHTKMKQLENITDKLNDVNKKLKTSQENVKAAKIGREPTREREEVLKKVAQLKAEGEALLKEIKAYETWEKMKKESEVVFKISFVAVINDQLVLALGACNDAFNNSDYILSDDRIIS
jgi:cytochrome oxidase Cu insertion factor (SCO1/SenC/PrrC family)